ncbi:MAG: hypothetical protein J0L60_11805 [Ignavibacteria bacterium]|nr:hypothetical protein [Ignavibacteria bacterium]
MKSRLHYSKRQSILAGSGSFGIVLLFILIVLNSNIVSQISSNSSSVSVPNGSVSPNSTAALSGTKYIGTGANPQDYATLTLALSALSSQGLSGPVVLELQSGYTSASETFPLTFSNFTGLGATNTLKIYPSTGVTGLSVAGSNTTAIINISNGDYITIDGRPGGTGSAKELTISNTDTNGTTVRFINDATNNTLKFLRIQGVATPVNIGVVLFSSSTGSTGNDFNTIDNCDIGDGVTTPTTGIYSAGSSGNINEYITISNCNIYNFFANIYSRTGTGILVSANNSDWTIQGNSIYQTSDRTFSQAGTGFIGISIFNTQGNNFNVYSNYIGGQQSGAGGAAWKQTGDFTHTFVGISMYVGSTTASKVNGNVIKNIFVSSATTSTVNSGISIPAGLAYVGYTSGNTIGDLSSTDNIVFITSGTGGAFSGIQFGSNGTTFEYIVRNNNIGGIRCSTATSGTITLRGIWIQGDPGSAIYPIISSNFVGGSVPNSLYNSTNLPTHGIHFSTGVTTINPTVDSNTVRNITSAGTGTSILTYGIYSQLYGAHTVRNNQVNNISTSSTATAGPAQLIGIQIAGLGAGNTITKNTVHTLGQLNTSATFASIIGIAYNGATTGTNLVANNFIHSLKLSTSAGSSTTVIKGLFLNDGVATVANNIIRVGIDETGASITGNYSVFGIDEQSDRNTNFYFNSIYVGGAGIVSSSTATYAFRSAGSNSGLVEFKNNIVVNARSNSSGSGSHYLMHISSSITSVSSNFNLFYYNGSGALFGYGATGNRANLSAWRVATLQDGNSGFGDPNFVAPIGTSSTVDLHVQSPTAAEGAGTEIASVTEDFDGQTRSGLTPVDIGADAGNFTMNDVFPPIITSSAPNSRTSSTGNLTFTATISDATGLPVTGSLVPRIWFRRLLPSASGWGSAAGTLQSGSATNGIWSFTTNYATATAGETYQIYYVAQDVVGTPNISTSPNGGAHTDVNTQTTAPSAPYSYQITSGYSGTYTVGTGGNYPTLTGAGGFFAAINAGAVSGNITVNILSDITEAGTNGLNQILEDGAGNYTLTIQPSDATVKNITGNYSGATLIRLDGCDRLTIDGRFGGSGRYLLFRQSHTGRATISIQSDASYNTIRNCIIEGAFTTTNGGVLTIAPGTTTVTGNDYNTITENQIRDTTGGGSVPANLIYVSGSSSSVRNSGTTISNNELFNFTNTAIHFALTNSANENSTITGNTIYQTSPSSAIVFGIRFYSLGNSNNISQNIIRDINTSSYAYGIYIEGTGTVTVARNRIYNFPSTSGSTGYLYGINNVGGSNSTSYIVNNQISIIPGFTNDQGVYGIRDGNSTSTTSYVYYNSVYIGGTGSGTTSTYGWDDGSVASTDVLKNNLFVNARTGGTGGHYAARHNGTASITDMTSDNNVFIGNGATLGSNFVLGNTAKTFAQYKAAFTGSGKDANSYSLNSSALTVANLFTDVATGNLNIIPTNQEAWLVAGKGVQLGIAGLTNIDYNGNSRSMIVTGGKTSIGSHEFSLAGLPAPPDATLSGAPSTSTPTTISVNGRNKAAITWFGAGLPSAVTVKFYSGKQHPMGYAGGGSNCYWTITKTGGTAFTYDLTLNYEDSDLGNVPENKINVAKWDGSTWQFITATVDTVNNTVTVTGLSSFSDFVLNDLDAPLPVELVNFSAKSKNRNVILSWETKTETDNSGFEVERKDKNGDWKKIGFVEGFGSSNSPKYYAFEDKKLSSGKHNYRLKQIDNDGTTSYSDEVEVTIDVPTEFALSQNYPNPFNPSTKVDYQLAMDAKVTIELYSITGEKVATLLSQELEAGYYSMMIDSQTNHLSSGVYLYRMIATDASGKNFVSTKKLSLIR